MKSVKTAENAIFFKNINVPAFSFNLITNDKLLQKCRERWWPSG